jgi:hypothetical protein
MNDETLYGLPLLRALCDESGRDDAHETLDELLGALRELRELAEGFRDRGIYQDGNELLARIDGLLEETDPTR